MLEPLGGGQVVSYIVGLAHLGYKYEILSLEKDSDRNQSAGEATLRMQLAAAGVSWTQLAYRNGGVVHLAGTYGRMFRELRRKWKSGRFNLLHARSFLMGLLARHVAGQQYIYDARGYWVDERREAGRWFRPRLIYQLAKRYEGKIARDAAAIVTLTDLQGNDFRAQFPGKPIMTIATCADFERFRPGAEASDLPQKVRDRLAGKLVLGLVGSINRSYRTQDSLRLYQFVRAAEPRAHLLCLTRQEREMREYLGQAHIAEEDFTLTSAAHDYMHEWMSLMHWGLLLLETSFAKRASMPTKLGEMFAAGVRPVQYGCNEEVVRLVREAGSGVVLAGVSDDDLRSAAAEIVRIGREKAGVLRAREKMRDHFSLETGTIRYAELLARAIRHSADENPPHRKLPERVTSLVERN